MSRTDPHSYFDDSQPRARHLRLDLAVDFERRVLEGTVVIELAAPGQGSFDLDTKGLHIEGVRAPDGRPLPHHLGAEEPILGRRLRIELPAGTTEIAIAYRTSPEAAALQWLEPAQTAGKRHPFLFSQCQAIHARSLVPCQDSARARVTYDATLTVPEALGAVMSAGPTVTRPGPRPGTRSFGFAMPQPIPTYLLALAVGEIVSRDLSPRSRVWAEPEALDAAAWEFTGIEHMLEVAEGLFGAYDWDRYDMLVLPQSFPYGGMENPRMTFLTPTLLAGDRSLVDVVAHELAHSWTGNLVTNATAEHFWLNEGFTVWAERRIVEALHGEEEAALAWAVGERALDAELARFGPASPLTRLCTDLAGVDPDDAFSSVPYEKGARLVVLLERAVGRPRFDRFIHDYMARFRFSSITTEELMAFVEAELPGVAARVRAHEWLYEPGMPDNAPVFRSEVLEGIAALASGFAGGARPTPAQIAGWSPIELQLYLQHLPRALDGAGCAWLDANLALTGRGNHELLVEWLALSLAADHEPVFARAREVLLRVGRMKYLRPLYRAMGRHPRTRALAASIFAEARGGYHALSRRVVEGVLEGYPRGQG